MKRLFILSLTVFIFAIGCVPKKQIVEPPLQPPLLRERLKELQKELEALTNEKEDLEAKIAHLEKENEGLVKKIEEDRIKSGEALKRLREENERIRKELGEYIKKEKIKVREEERGLVITLIDKVLFDTGKADIKKEAVTVLNKVAEIIKKYKDRGVVIEGHTDSVPISTWKFPSNWELSTRRATEVLRFFIKRHNISPLRLQAAGYGEYRPIATNKTAAGRRKNRRVEIILLPADYLREVTTLQ